MSAETALQAAGSAGRVSTPGAAGTAVGVVGRRGRSPACAEGHQPGRGARHTGPWFLGPTPML